MAEKKVAELLVDVLEEAEVQRMYGVSGDSLNGITDAVRSANNIQWVHVRHEETAAFAAGAEAHVTGCMIATAVAYLPWPSPRMSVTPWSMRINMV